MFSAQKKLGTRRNGYTEGGQRRSVQEEQKLEAAASTLAAESPRSLCRRAQRVLGTKTVRHVMASVRLCRIEMETIVMSLLGIDLANEGRASVAKASYSDGYW